MNQPTTDTTKLDRLYSELEEARYKRLRAAVSKDYDAVDRLDNEIEEKIRLYELEYNYVFGEAEG